MKQSDGLFTSVLTTFSCRGTGI